MIQEVLYNIYNPGVLKHKQEELTGKFIVTELDRQYISVSDNLDSFEAEARDRLGEIYRYIIIGYNNGGNWTGLLTLYKRRLDHLLTDYINRLVESRKYEVDEIIEEMEKWIDTTSEVIFGIIEEQKEDVLTKGAIKGTINPATTKKRIEALDSVRDDLLASLEEKQNRFLHDLPEMDFAEIGPEGQPGQNPQPKKKPGKQPVSFESCIVNPEKKDKVISKLKTLIGDKKGKEAYIILAAAMYAGIITRPPYKAVEATFGHLGAESGFSRKMVPRAFTKEELQPIKEQVEKLK